MILKQYGTHGRTVFPSDPLKGSGHAVLAGAYPPNGTGCRLTRRVLWRYGASWHAQNPAVFIGSRADRSRG
jgi:hypothetical protein